MTSSASMQVIKAVENFTMSGVIRAVVNRDVTGDGHIADNIDNGSSLEELNDGLTKAVFAFASKIDPTLRLSVVVGHPYKYILTSSRVCCKLSLKNIVEERRVAYGTC